MLIRNAQERSAGHIGCAPDEILITEADGVASASIWLATCRGKHYRCSATGDGNIACKEDEHAVAYEQPRPRGGGGFELGADLDSTMRACAAGGHAWRQVSADAYSCSSIPRDVGLPGTALITMCSGKVCQIALSMPAPGRNPSEWVEQFRRLEGALKQKYGDEADRQGEEPRNCGSVGPEECTRESTNIYEYRWSWPSREQIHLMLETKRTRVAENSFNVASTIHLTYKIVQPKVAPGPSSAPAPLAL